MKTNDGSSRDLRARLRSGEPDAFSELFRQHDRAVLGLAFKLLGDWPSAEDIAAETFLAAWVKRGAIRDEDGSLAPWLLTIATHKALNVRRGQSRLAAFVQRHDRGTSVPDFADDVAARVDASAHLQRARGLLARLPVREAEVLVLLAWGDLSYEEIAKHLAVPLGTVRSRLSRGRSRLRRLSAEPPDIADRPDRRMSEELV